MDTDAHGFFKAKILLVLVLVLEKIKATRFSKGDRLKVRMKILVKL